MFLWSALAHTALPIGDASLAQVSRSSVVAATLEAELGDRDGLYAFPGVGGDPHGDGGQERGAMIEKKTGASGLIVYHGPGQSTGHRR